MEPIATPVVVEGDEGMGPTMNQRVDWNEHHRAWVAPYEVVHDAPAFIRRQRVLPLAVNPVFYDPKTNDLVVATKIEIDVRFDGGSATRAERSPANDGKQWNDVFGRMFVNAQQARNWRAPKPELASTALAAARAAPGAVKLHVRDTGVYKVSAATLSAAGFPAGQPVANIRLYRRTYNDVTLTPGETEVPVYVREGATGVPGVLDAADIVVFYGLRLRGDHRATRASGTRHQHVLAGPGPGPRWPRAPALGFVTADTTAAFFRHGALRNRRHLP